MATVNNRNLTFLDRVRRTDPNGAIAQIAEVLTKTTPVLEDAVFRPSNLPDANKVTARNALPPVYRRRFNEGIPTGKSGTAQVTEPCTNIAARSEVDAEEAELNGDVGAYRASEDVAFLEAMNEGAESALIYDSQAGDPTQMNGLLPRLNSTADPVAGKQIVLWGAGGANINASLLLVGWGDQTVYGHYPKGTPGGLKHVDMGVQYSTPDGSGNRFRAYCADWSWMLGLTVKDSRYFGALRNIDMSALQEGNPQSPVSDLVRGAIKVFHKIPRPSSVRMAWYAPRLLVTYLHLQALSVQSRQLRVDDDPAGAPVVKLLGYPVRIADSMTTTEAAIS